MVLPWWKTQEKKGKNKWNMDSIYLEEHQYLAESLAFQFRPV